MQEAKEENQNYPEGRKARESLSFTSWATCVENWEALWEIRENIKWCSVPVFKKTEYMGLQNALTELVIVSSSCLLNTRHIINKPIINNG